MVVCFLVVRKSAELARFALFVVAQSHQRRGLGRHTIAYAEDYCRRTWAVKTLDMSALSTREKLISWYMRCGYQKTDKTEPFPRAHAGGAALPDDLYFVVLEKSLDVTPIAAEAA